MIPFLFALIIVIVVIIIWIPSSLATTKDRLQISDSVYYKKSNNPTDIGGQENSLTSESKYFVSYVAFKSNRSSVQGVPLENSSEAGLIALDSNLSDKVSTCKTNLTCTMNNS